MTAATPRSVAPAAPHSLTHRPSWWAVTRAIARRNLLGVFRNPAAIIPSLAFPFLFIVALTGAYSGVANVPGFPTEKLVTWMLPFTVMQSSAIVGMTTGLGVIGSIQTKFYDRLLMSPVPRTSLVAGLYLGAMARTLIPTLMVSVLGFAQGAALPGGVVGYFWLLVAGQGACIVAAGWGIGMALRVKTFAAAPILFMVVFISTFMTPMQVPLSFLSGWLAIVARWNPVTRIVNLARAGFVGHNAWSDVWPGLAVIAVGAVLLGWFAVRGQRALDS
jgi:ABC-2 type transport system permease protein